VTDDNIPKITVPKAQAHHIEPLPGSVGKVDPDAIWIEVGKIGRPHGLKGEVRLQVYNPDSEIWHSGQKLRAWLPGKPAVLVQLASYRDILPMPTAALTGVTDRDVAAKLTHAVLAVNQEELPDTDEDEFYLHELIGAQVLDDATRKPVGVVRALLETPSDVLEISLNSGASAMIPVHAEAITEMGRQKGILVVRDISDWQDK
jgi:16S rRNA processing protein RimM